MERRNKRLALIHLARKDRGLDDVAYRALLMGAAGVDSAADITNDKQFVEVMRAFTKLGFHAGARKRLPVTDEQRGKLCTERQRFYIKGLWELASRNRDEKSLRAMVKRIAGVDDIRFLTKQKATALILALRDIAVKAGFNPDGPADGR